MTKYLMPLLFALIFFGWWGIYRSMKSQLNAEQSTYFDKRPKFWWQCVVYLLLLIAGFVVVREVPMANVFVAKAIWIFAVVVLAMSFRTFNKPKLLAVGLHEDFVLKSINAVMVMQIALVLVLANLPANF